MPKRWNRVTGELPPEYAAGPPYHCAQCRGVITRSNQSIQTSLRQIRLGNQEHLFCGRKCLWQWNSEHPSNQTGEVPTYKRRRR